MQSCKRVRTFAQARRLVGQANRPKIEEKARLRIKARGLMEQLQWWESRVEEGTIQLSDCAKDIENLRRQMKRLESLVPSATWYDDARMIPVRKGGEFPPPAENTPMVRARGETRFYPRAYITTSGHTYDIFLQEVHLHSRQHLLDDDGYRGGIVSIHDLQATEKTWLHRRENVTRKFGKAKIITNVM